MINQYYVAELHMAQGFSCAEIIMLKLSQSFSESIHLRLFRQDWQHESKQYRI